MGAAWFTLFQPYAQLDGRMYSSAKNIFKYAIVILLGITIQYCYGAYEMKVKNWMLAIAGVVGADLFFYIVSFAKDGRKPTKEYGIALILVAATLGMMWWDSKNYVYEKREIK